MKPSEQLRWEAENGPKAAAAAFAAGGLLIVSFIFQRMALGGAHDNRSGLIAIHEHSGELLVNSLAQALSVFALSGALFYLIRAIVARRPEQLRFLWPLLVVAPILLLVAAVLSHHDAVEAANHFAEGAQTKARAKHIAHDIRGTTTGIVGQLGALTLALSYVLVSVNAMRTGLLSRFMGILGMVAGALFVIPLLPATFIQLFWIVALGVLFLNRWPNGRGPAWSAVEVIPWPTAAQVREMAAEGTVEATATTEPAPAPAPAEEKPGPSRSSRKKRKKRR